MSQAMGMSSGSRAGSSKAMPVLLLALAVALTTALLHGLDNSPTATEASLAATQTAQESAVTPTTAATTQTTVAAARPASEIKVLIANGTTTAGAAAKLNSLLVPAGYQLGTPGNTTAPMAETSVQYQTGFEAEARGVAQALGLSNDTVRQMSDPAPIADTQGANVVVVMGDALAASTNANVATPTTTAVSNALNGPLGNLQTSTTVAGATSSASGGSAATSNQSQSSTATTSAR